MARRSLLLHHDFCQRWFYVTRGKRHMIRSSRLALSPSLLRMVKGYPITTLEGESLEIEAMFGIVSILLLARTQTWKAYA